MGWGGSGGRGSGGGRAKSGVRGRGRAGPNIDPLLDHSYITFEDGSEAFHINERFRRVEMSGYAPVDWAALEEVDKTPKARVIIGHQTPLFDLAFLLSHRVMICDFYPC
ncbi:hypothetical protein Hanom_Chr02g00140351 [Helianthus anomalus]